MNKFFGLFCVLSALMILSSLFIGNVFATSQFDDHFLNLFNWDILPTNSVDWIINDNSLVGSVGKNGNSYIFLKNFEFSNKFELTYDAKSVVGVDQELIFRVDRNNHTFYVINTRFYEPNWSQDGANEVILWRCFSFSENVCSLVSKNEHLGFNLNKNQFYKFKLAVDDKHINFSIDGTVVMDHTFNDSYLGGVGFWNWGGQFGGGVSNIYKNFSIVSYDYIFPTPTSIQMNTPTLTPINTPTSPSTPTPTLTPTLTPTPTLIPTLTPTEVPSPTPTPTEIPRKKKIFILPGLGASWNSKAIVYGENVTNDQWKMTPFVNNYNGLIELLNINGLEKDKDYYVWNYDWRKNLSEIEKDFNNYVGSKNLSTNDEIYLIGHSLGGVVARLWAQDHSDNSNIKQVVNLGSPNLGSLDVYSVWNGGKVMKSSGLSSTVFNIILGLQNKGFVITDLDKIRNFAPIAKDLLPTFDYAIKNKKTIGWRSMNSYNSFLDDENKKVSRIDSKLKLFVGTGEKTPEILTLGNRSWMSKSLGLWPDGEISSYSTADGDGTVLKKSARANLSNIVEIKSDHGEITSKSLNQMAAVLGLLKTSISSVYNDNFSDGLVVFVGSPVTSQIKCGSDTFWENDGFILVPGKNYDDCELTLSPTGDGLVHVVLGNLKTSQWNYFEDEVVVDKPEKIIIDYSKAEIKVSPSNKQFLKDRIKTNLEKLGLNKVVKFLDKNDLAVVAGLVFEYRAKHDERIVTQTILNDLFDLSLLNSGNKKENYKWLATYVDLIEGTVELKSKRKVIDKNSTLGLLSLTSLKNKTDNLVKNKTYPGKVLLTVLSLGYGVEAMR